MEGRKLENPGKNPRNTGENQQTTLLTYDTKYGEARPRVALVRGERYDDVSKDDGYANNDGWWWPRL